MDVPSGTNVTGLADLIAAIESSAKIANGRFKPASDTISFTIEHGLGVIPKFFIVTITPSYSVSAVSIVFVAYADANSFDSFIPFNSGWVGAFSRSYFYNGSVEAEKLFSEIGINSITINVSSKVTSSQFKVTQYSWLAIA